MVSLDSSPNLSASLAPLPPIEFTGAEMEALLAGSRDLAATLDLPDVLLRILDRLQALVDYTGTGIVLREGDAWITEAARGPFGAERVTQHPINGRSRLVRQIVSSRAPAVIVDVDAEPGLLTDLLNIVHAPVVESFGYIRSWMGAPLLVAGEVIGLLFVDHEKPGWFTPRRRALVLALTDQAAVAVKNARMFRDAQTRLAELNGMQRVTSALLESHDLGAILEIACREACVLTEAEASAVFGVEEEKLFLARQLGTIDLCTEAVQQAVRDCSRNQQAPGRPVACTTSSHMVGPAGCSAPLAVVPLQIREQCIGALCVARQGADFGVDELRVLRLLADNVAMALNSTELARQGEQFAVMKERQRLATELHDSVTQALYGATLLVDAADIALGAGRYEAARIKLHKLQDTIDEAMRGMRVMIFELRPLDLEEGLGVAIERRLATVESRVGLQASLAVHDERRIDETIEVEVYWIVTECLNNVVKHAQAEHVSVELRYRENGLAVTIQDDGVGFDVGAVDGQMGLGIAGMRERARSIGATLVIDSQRGHGSHIRLTAPR